MRFDEISEIIHPVSEEFLSHCEPRLLGSWLLLYPKPWLKEELVSASLWILANPKRAPKSQYGRFFTSWLRRAKAPTPDPSHSEPVRPIDLESWEHGYGRKA